MSVRRVLSHEKVAADAGRVALERGPVVYCAEAVDNGGRAFNLVLPDDAPLEARAARRTCWAASPSSPAGRWRSSRARTAARS